MSAFRDDFGAVLERIARLEDENERLRAELLLFRVEPPGGASESPEAPGPTPSTWNWEATCWIGVLFIGIVAAFTSLHLAYVPIVLDASGTESSASTTDIAFGCTTPFVYEVKGVPRAACLSMPP